MAKRRLALDDGSLVDLLDRLIDTGVALDGTVLLTLAGLDLIELDLRLLLASVGGRPATSRSPAMSPTPARVRSPQTRDRATDRNTGIGGLVVALADIVRQLLERQVLRRLDEGRLTQEETERVGSALHALEEQVVALASAIGTHRELALPVR